MVTWKTIASAINAGVVPRLAVDALIAATAQRRPLATPLVEWLSVDALAKFLTLITNGVARTVEIFITYGINDVIRTIATELALFALPLDLSESSLTWIGNRNVGEIVGICLHEFLLVKILGFADEARHRFVAARSSIRGSSHVSFPRVIRLKACPSLVPGGMIGTVRCSVEDRRPILIGPIILALGPFGGRPVGGGRSVWR